MSRRQVAESLDAVAKAAFGPDARVAHVNYGDGERRAMLWSRRYERALRRSLRNHPPVPLNQEQA